jgi:hypothetical protein
MQILILGDSWAVELPGMKDQCHLVSFLKQAGHTVTNYGIAGGSNLDSLALAQKNIDQSTKFDWVVWFHTELSRDKEKISWKSMSIDQIMQGLSCMVYKDYQKFFQRIGSKIAVIGGCADLHNNFFQFIQPNFCISSWLHEIIGVNVECMSTPKWVPYVKDSTDKKLPWLEAHSTAYNAMIASLDFPDDAHPGTKPHKDLAQRLLNAL